MEMLKIILLLVLIQHGISDFVKYYDSDGDEPWKWRIVDYKHRPCRDEEGWHRCVDRDDDVEICIARYAGPYYHCAGHPPLNCTDDEMELFEDGYYQCTPRYLIQYWFNSANIYLRCPENEFQCKVSEKCIPRHFVQDGHNDCNLDLIELSDNSDETNFIPNCFEESEFRCNASNSRLPRCIPRNWVMNGVRDCVNGEDENTTLNCHNNTEYECPQNKSCILRRYVNDHVSDCSSSDDELVKNYTCIDQLEFSCDKGNGIRRCIPREWVGNGIEDCSNGEDERVVPMECLDEQVKCLDNKRCLLSKYICDGIQNCNDGSDEVELCSSPTMYRYQPQRLIPWSFILFNSESDINQYDRNYRDFQLPRDLAFGLKCYVRGIVDGRNRVYAKLRTIPQFYISNNISVCSNNEDNCFDGQNSFTCARCIDGTIITKSQICDDVIDCKDLSDECLCENSKVVELCENVFSFQNNSEHNKGNIDVICNGEVDMVNGKDEEYCNEEVLEFNGFVSKKYLDRNQTFICSTKHIKGYSISSNQTTALYCDGNVDCPLMEDECSSDCLRSKVWRGEKLNECFPFIEPKPGYITRQFDNFEIEIFWGLRYFVNVSITYDGKIVLYKSPTTTDQQNRTDQEAILCNRRYKFEVVIPFVGTDMRYYGRTNNDNLPLNQTGHQLCDNSTNRYEEYAYSNLNFLCDNINIDGVKCPWFHICDEGRKIEISRRCDYKIDCNDNSDEADCPNHFYCNNGNPWFISKDKVGDGRSDCTDRSDEIRVTAFSSGTEMLKNMFLRVFVWFCAFSILICNGVVLRKHFIKIRKTQSKTTVPYCNMYLLICLAISDSIFGLILLAIGIKSQQLSGKYYEFDLDWRSSFACTMIGIFTVISSQTSVNLLILMTGLRFYITYLPYMTKRINFNLLVVFSFLSLGISIFLASFPVWGNLNFINLFYIKPNLFLDSDVVIPGRVKDYMTKTEIVSLLTNSSTSVTQGGDEMAFAQKLENWFFNSEEGRKDFPNRQIDIKGDLAFYSSSSVCFPDYFSKTSPASGYSLFIVLYNLTSLLLICIGYILIFRRARQSATTAQTADEERANKKIRKMMIRISFIVVTDILCWLPVIIMSILSYGGYDLPEIAHPLSAIVFLPINSMINPMIYSRLDKTIKRNFKKLFCPIWIRYCGEETENQTEQQPKHRTVEQIPMQEMGNRVEESTNV